MGVQEGFASDHGSSPLDETAPAAAEYRRKRPRASWAVIGIFLLLAVAGLAYARMFLTPVLLAFLLALVFSPVRRALTRMGLSTGLAAVSIVLSLVATLLVVGTLLATPVIGWIENAPQIGGRLEERVRELRTSLAGNESGKSVGEVVEDLKDAVAPSEADEPTVRIADVGLMEQLVALVPSIAVQTILVLVLLLFLLASGDLFYEKIVQEMPRFRDKRRAMKIAHGIERKLSRYLLTITTINAGLGVCVGVSMWLLGMPDPLLFGVIAWLFNYVPYVGAIAGSALTLAVGLLTFDGFWPAVLPGLVYYALTAVEGQFVTPYLVGRNLKLNTVVVFVTIAFWAWLWSVIGMLIAVPVLVAIRTFCEAIPRLRPVANFLSAERPGTEEEEVADDPRDLVDGR